MSPDAAGGALVAMDSTDKELVAAARSGEVEAFTKLVQRYQARVFAIACANTDDKGLAEDACQDAFVIAWQRLETLKDDEAIGSWLCGIARNRTRALKRKGNRESLGGAMPTEPSDEKTPLDDLMDREAAESLWTLVGQIPARYREPMLLHYSGDQSVASIAECLSLSDSAVKKRLSRGRTMLRDQSERFGELARACRAPASLATAVALLVRQQAASASTLVVGGSISATIVKGLIVKKSIAAGILLTLCIGAFVAFKPSDEAPAAASKVERVVAHAEPDVVITPPSKSGLVHGTVIDAATGQPIAGAHISASRNHGLSLVERVRLMSQAPPMVIADQEGMFAIELAAGDVVLSASAEGFVPLGPLRVSVAAERTTDIALKLVAGGVRFHGRVRDIGGGSIAGATVRCDQGEGLPGARHRQQITQTTNEGEFELWLARGEYQLSVHHLDYAPHTSELLIGGSEFSQDINLIPGGSIEGVVLAVDSMLPVPGAVIFSSTGAHKQGAVSDERGRFRLARVPPGTTQLRASASGSTTLNPQTVDLGVGETRGEIELFLEAAYDIRGRVVDSSGQAVQGADVELSDMSGLFEHPARVPTDERGRFVIEGVAPGTHSLGASHREHPLALSLNAATIVDRDLDGVVITFSEAVNLVGKVVPATPSTVYVANTGGLLGSASSIFGNLEGLINNSMSPTRVRPDGSFELPPLPVGRYQVLALADDGRRGSVVTSTSNEDVALEIFLEDTVTLAGVIRTAGGDEVPGLLVTITSQEHLPAQTVGGRTDSNGRYTLRGLSPGKYEVSLKDSECPRRFMHQGEPTKSTWNIHVEGERSSQTVGFDFTVTNCGVSLAGTVVDASGAPVADTWIYAKAGDSETTPVLSLEDGTFVIAGLAQDVEVDLHAYHPSQGRAKLAHVAPGSEQRVELSAGAALQLQVQGKSGSLGSFQVALLGPSNRSQSVKSQTGTTKFSGLTPGNYTIHVASDDGYADEDVTIDITDTRKKVALEITEWSVLRGRVVDDDGNPSARAWLTPVDDDFRKLGDSGAEVSSFFLSRSQADSSGSFALRRVRAGTSGIIVAGEAGAIGWIPLKIAGGEVLDLGDVTPEPPPSASP